MGAWYDAGRDGSGVPEWFGRLHAAPGAARDHALPNLHRTDLVGRDAYHRFEAFAHLELGWPTFVFGNRKV